MGLRFNKFDYKTKLDEQRKIFSLCFPETKDTYQESKEHYMWKFHSFPSTPHSFEYSVSDDNKILGYYAAIPYKYKIEGKELVAGMVCDVMTHPDARGKGIFTKIGKYATDDLRKSGVNFSTGYPIRPEVIPGHIKVGWTKAFKLPIYILPIKSNSILKIKKLAFLSPFVNLCLAIYQTTLKHLFPVHCTYNVKAYSVSEFLQLNEYDQFFNEWSKDQKYYLIKDRFFLKWRLGANSSAYTIYCVHEKNTIKAMAITKITTLEKVKTMAILDLMVPSSYYNLTSQLFMSLKANAIKNGAEIIATMISKSWAKKYSILSSCFLKTPLVFTFITKPFNIHVSETDFFDEKNWHLMWIDSDDL